jgi:uncharacterized repeat protein (TIGR02543 family)
VPKRALLTLVLIVSLSFLAWFASSKSTTSKSLTKAEPSTTLSMPSKEAVSAKLATLERGWVKNEGQWDQRALFSAPGYFGNTWITKDGELLHVAVKKEKCKDKTTKARACPSKSWVISERWVGGKVQTVKGEEELQTKVSYFIGNDPSKHKSGLSTYRYVSLGEVWSGVEVKLKATQKTVEKLFYVQPGADPSKIQVQVDGTKGLKLSKDGEIIIQTGLGDLKLSKPIAWQEKDGKKLPVEVSYKLIGKNRYSFEVAKADPSLPLVIDPILQSTYLGGSNDDWANTLAVHPATGEVYVAGLTWSANFPNTAGGAQASFGGFVDAFVARLNATLTSNLQSTYLGGTGDDEAHALAIASSGEVYVAGWTRSTNFPNTSGGAQASNAGFYDAFVARLSADLTSNLQSTYLGGTGYDAAHALAIASSGEVYVAGVTNSTNFPNTSGGAQASKGGGDDAFVARLSADLTSNLQSTYLGGGGGGPGFGDDWAFALAVHPATGEVYVAGKTSSTNFPNTAGGAQASYSVLTDAFVARLSADLTSNPQSTYLGGGAFDEAHALAIASSGEVYVAGATGSTNFPNTSGGAQASNGGGLREAFVARLNASLTSNPQSTYLGGSNDDWANTLAVHPATGEVYVAGWTRSTDFPNTSGGAQGSNGGGSDAFVARLNATLTSNLQSTYLGGTGYDAAHALAIASSGEVYVAGVTGSTDFPNTSGGAQASNGGGDDAFVARLTADLAAGASSYTLSISPTPTNGNVTSSPSGINCGSGGSTCSASFTGTVTLTATPDAGYTFAGWGGDCSGCGTSTTCNINMNANKTCSANFTASTGGGTGIEPPTLSVVSTGFVGQLGGVDFRDVPINTQKGPAIIKIESKNPIFISGIRINEFRVPSILQGITDFFRGLFGLKEQEVNFILDPNAGDRPCSSTSFNLAGYCTVGVIFQPKSEGKKQAYLEVYYNQPYPVKVYITGTGISQQQAPPSGGSGGSSGGGSGGSSGGVSSSGGGGGCSMGGSASGVNALGWLLLPAFALVRRLRRR